MRHRRRRRRRGPLSPAQRKRQLRNRAILAGGLLMMVFLVLIIVKVAGRSQERPEGLEDLLEPDYEVNLLTPNEYSRPGIALDKVNGIVIHYTANPGSSAVANRDYFESLSISHETMASSHFIIGLDGEVVQCIPTAEISYASNDRNDDTISIECCHPDETGEFTEQTYDSLVQTTAWLCVKFDLTTKDVIRHYDVTGKDCPRYFVQNEGAWKKFKKDVDKYINEVGDKL